MAKLSELQQALANPNAKKMLDLIAASEGVKHGYNTLFGNQQFQNLGSHPNIRKEFTQTDGKKNYTTAAGRYQFLNGTWQNLAKQYGLRDFSPQNQDLGAIALIARRGALKDVLNGDYKTAIGKLGQEWASLPSSTYKQGKRSWDFVNKNLGQNVGSDVPQQIGSISAGDFQKIRSNNPKPIQQTGSISADEYQKIMNSSVSGSELQAKSEQMGGISAQDFQKIMTGG